MSQAHRIPVCLENPACLADHRAEGRSVLPAVLALQALAREASARWPGLEVARSRDARFLRFLETPADRSPVEAEVEFEPLGPGEVRARLLTRKAAGTSGLARNSIHVEATFGGSAAATAPLPCLDTLGALSGPCLAISSQRLYSDLVPFGPCFHNALGLVQLSADGALGRLRAALHPLPQEPLGSVFPLDAAFHLACAWGQRYAGELTFPTGFAERRVRKRIEPGEEVSCRVLPMGREGERLLFDLWLTDDRGELREACLGLVMQDVARGRMPAAAWVRDDGRDPLGLLRAACLGFEVQELDAVAQAASGVLTPAERVRFDGQGARRRRAYLGARLALKRLGRGLTGDWASPPGALETSAPDGILPACPGFSGRVSAAHDDRFAVAVAGERPIGVDVERLAPRVLSTRRMFLDEAEQALVRESPLGELRAATRAWCAKEAAAKAWGFGLGGALERVRIAALAEDRVELELLGEPAGAPAVRGTALTAELDGHVFALLVLWLAPSGEGRAQIEGLHNISGL